MRYYDEAGKQMRFDHARFYDWAVSIAALPVISEREMPPDRFACIAEKVAANRLCATKTTQAVERLFVPKNRLDEYKSRMQDKGHE